MLYLSMIIKVAASFVLITIGWKLWHEQAMNAISFGGLRKINKENIPACTKRMGIALLIMGANLLITSILNNLVNWRYTWVITLPLLIIAILIMVFTYFKYREE